jgi:hypothetical protein
VPLGRLVLVIKAGVEVRAGEVARRRAAEGEQVGPPDRVVQQQLPGGELGRQLVLGESLDLDPDAGSRQCCAVMPRPSKKKQRRSMPALLTVPKSRSSTAADGGGALPSAIGVRLPVLSMPVTSARGSCGQWR